MNPQQPTTEDLTIDDIIFNIEDYVGGNIEGIENIDRMGFTVFLRKQLSKLLVQTLLNEVTYWHKKTIHEAPYPSNILDTLHAQEERIKQLRNQNEEGGASDE